MSGSLKPGPSTGSTTPYQINSASYKNRLEIFYASWQSKKNDLWGSSNAIFSSIPPRSEGIHHLKSTAISTWLFGQEMYETIVVFLPDSIHIICDPKNASVLEPLKEITIKTVQANMVLYVKTKNEDVCDQMNQIVHLIKSKNENPLIGCVTKEPPQGNLLEDWTKKLGGAASQICDISTAIAEMLYTKDSTELKFIREAASINTAVMKNFVVPELEKIIKGKEKVTHATLSDLTMGIINDPVQLDGNLESRNVEICYDPIFRSGGEFDLRENAEIDAKHLYCHSASVIICSFGVRYNKYCANLARSFIIDGVPVQLKAYRVLLSAHKAIMDAVKPERKLSDVYDVAVQIVRQEAPELVPNMSKCAGWGIGLELCESGLKITSKNDKRIKKGMVLNLTLGFHNVNAETKNPKTKKFSLLVADTVIVTENGTELLTACLNNENGALHPPKKHVNVEENRRMSERGGGESSKGGPIQMRLRSSNRESSKKKESRMKHQNGLARKLLAETMERLVDGEDNAGDSEGPLRTSNELVAYTSPNEMPYSKELKIQVDQENEAVLLPVYGRMVPFHISTVKRVTCHQENRTCTVGIIFNVPGPAFNPHDSNAGAIHLKGITFRSKDLIRSSEVVRQINRLHDEVASRGFERAERETLVPQEILQVANTAPTSVPNLLVRTSFSGKGAQVTGTLEAHVNGFRYSTSRPEEILDIIYNNVKHGFFQQGKMITLLHLHLRNGIMVSNKKVEDIQFSYRLLDKVKNTNADSDSDDSEDDREKEKVTSSIEP